MAFQSALCCTIYDFSGYGVGVIGLGEETNQRQKILEGRSLHQVANVQRDKGQQTILTKFLLHSGHHISDE